MQQALNTIDNVNEAFVDAFGAGDQDDTGFIRVDADGTNLEVFELTDLVVGEFSDGISFESMSITGFLQGGGTVSGTITDVGSDIIHSTDLSNFSGQAITGFRIDFDATSTSTPGDFSIRTFDWQAVNAAPSVDNFAGDDLSYDEGDGAQVIDQGTEVTVTDGDSGDLNGGNLTLTTTAGGDSGEDVLGIDTGGAVILPGGTTAGSNVQVSGTTIGTLGNNIAAGNDLMVNFNSSATVSLVQTLARALTYENNDTSDPTTGARTVRLTVNDGDGGTSSNADATVTVNGINDQPTLTATAENPTFTEGDPARDLFSAITASTVESAQTFTSMTLTVNNVTDGSDERLSFDGSTVQLTNGFNVANTAVNGLNVNVSLTGSVATVSFSGAALNAAALQTLVGGLAYQNLSDDPGTASDRTVTLSELVDSGGTANGGDDTADPNEASTVSLTSVNDPPATTGIDGDDSEVTAGAGTQDVTLFDDATVTNPDSPDYNGGFASLVQNSGTTNGSWAVDGTSVTAGGDAVIAAGETVAVGGTAIGTVNVTNDGQGGNTLEIDFDTGNATSARIQTLLQNLGYSAPSGLGDRGFTLTLNDGDGTANGGDEDVTADFTIDVTPNPPVVGNLDGDSVDAASGVVASIDEGNDATVTDADSPDFSGGTLLVTRTGGLSGDFSLSGSGGTGVSSGNTLGAADGTISAAEVVYVDGTPVAIIASDGQGTNDLQMNLQVQSTPALTQEIIRALLFSSNTAGAHTFDLTVTDNGPGSDPATSATSSFTVTVLDGPIVLNLDTDAVGYTEGDGAVVLDQGTAASVTDADNADFNGGSLTVTISAGEDPAQDLLSFNTGGGVVSFPGGATAGQNVNVNGITVGTLANNVAAGNDLVVNFNADATPARATSMLQALTYENTGGDEPTAGARTVDVTVADGTAAPAGSATVTVTVIAVNDAPTLTATGEDPSFNEGDAPTLLFSGSAINTIEAGQTISGVVVQVIPVTDPGEEFLTADGTSIALTDGVGATTATNGLTYAVSTSGAGVSITFTGGSLTPAEAQAFVDALAYRNTAVNPDESDRVVTLAEITDSGGTADGGSDTSTPSIASTIEVGDVILPAPELDTSTPADGATDIAQDAEVTLTLDQAVTEIDLSGVTITDEADTPVGGVAATLDGDQLLEIAHDLLDNDQTYTVTLPAGAVQNIDGVANAEITVSFTTLLHGPADASETTAEVPEEGVTGTATTITVTLRDAFGNLVSGEAAQLSASVTDGPNTGATFTAVTDNGDGTYTTSYTPAAAGTDRIAITLGGTSIPDSPFESLVIPNVTPPGAPTGLTAAEGDGQAELEWQAPTDDGDGDISDYTVQYSTNEGATWTEAAGSGPATERTVSGLTNNLGHQFRVAAVNEAGSGPFSEPSEVTVPTAPVPDPDGGLPDPDPGSGAGFSDGEPLQLTIVTGEDGTLQLVLAGGDFTLVLASLDPDDQLIPLSAFDELFRLLAEAGASIQVGGEGFEPGSWVTIWLFSDPVQLGVVEVDSDGNFEDTLPLPSDLEAGSHTLQITGRGPAGQQQSVSLGVLATAIHAPVNTASPSVADSSELRIGGQAVADPGQWTGTPQPLLTTRWLRCAGEEQPAGECLPIEEVVGPTYEVRPADLGSYLRAEVTADNGIHAPVTAASAPVGPIGAGAASAPQSTAQVPDGLAGEPTVVTVRLEDAHGNPVSGAAGDLILSVTSGTNVGASFSEVEGHENGTYSASYVPRLPGTDRLSITLEGEPVGESPYASQIGPLENELLQNYPNPFGGPTTIEYSVVAPAEVTLKVYDVLGRVVRTLVEIPSREPGEYSLTWTPTGLASGVYYYRLVITPDGNGEPFMKTLVMTYVR